MSRSSPTHQSIDPVAEFVANPEALLWASACGWFPGTGYCRNHPCLEQCPLHSQRAAEQRRILRLRRDRRVRRSSQRTARLS